MIIETEVDVARGDGETRAGLTMLERCRELGAKTVGADEDDDDRVFVGE